MIWQFFIKYDVLSLNAFGAPFQISIRKSIQITYKGYWSTYTFCKEFSIK